MTHFNVVKFSLNFPNVLTRKMQTNHLADQSVGGRERDDDLQVWIWVFQRDKFRYDSCGWETNRSRIFVQPAITNQDEVGAQERINLLHGRGRRPKPFDTKIKCEFDQIIFPFFSMGLHLHKNTYLLSIINRLSV